MFHAMYKWFQEVQDKQSCSIKVETFDEQSIGKQGQKVER